MLSINLDYSKVKKSVNKVILRLIDFLKQLIDKSPNSAIDKASLLIQQESLKKNLGHSRRRHL